MALGNSANRIYLGISDGKIVQKCSEHTQGAQPRTKKDGSVIFELRYGFITAMLNGISTKKTEWQGTEIKSWVLQLSDAGENYQLEFNYDSAYAKSFLKALLNPVVDLMLPLTITPWQKIVNEKKKSAIYLSQGNDQIEWFFTKDNPNGLPELKEVTIKGKQTWDDYDVMQFLEAKVNSEIIPKIKNQPVYTGPAYAAPSDINTDIDDDSLPF